MAERPRSDSGTHEQVPADPKVRERAVGSMVSASLMAALGTLIFAWALRAPDYPWLFAVGALPWIVGIVQFMRGLIAYLKN